MKNIEAIKQVLSAFPEIESVKIYGSRAKGNYRNGSDIDLALIGDQVSLQTVLRLATQLDDLDLPYEFDLCVYHQINNLDFKDHIDRVGILFS
ncbi:MAG: nucleotidyltransferase domain-containing protein [Myxococcaceae bacterium]